MPRDPEVGRSNRKCVCGVWQLESEVTSARAAERGRRRVGLSLLPRPRVRLWGAAGGEDSVDQDRGLQVWFCGSRTWTGSWGREGTFTAAREASNNRTLFFHS